MNLSEIPQPFLTEYNNTAFTPAGWHKKDLRYRSRVKPATPAWNAWRDSQRQIDFQRGRKHASESTAGRPKKPHAWLVPLCTSAEQLPTILLQLNINGLQEALSCYSMLVKCSLMHIHTELPHMAVLCFHSARRANDTIWPLRVAWLTEDGL